MNLSNRILKIEREIKPTQTAPGVIIAYKKEEAREKLQKYREEFPFSETPVILIVPDIKKPPPSGKVITEMST